MNLVVGVLLVMVLGLGSPYSPYDVMGRCTSRTFKKPDGTIEDTHVFTYDIVGRRLTAENASVKVASTWDLMDRETLRTVTFKTDPRTPLVRKLSFTHDAVGRRKSMDDHAGRVARYTYDLAGQLTRLDLESKKQNGQIKTRTYRFTYDAVGNLLETIFPNNVRTRRTYDSDHRLTQILHETVTVANNSDGTVTATPVATLQKFDYTLDPLGNITRIDELEGKGWRYAYDAASRLVEAHMSEPLFQALSAKDDRLTAAEKAALADDGVDPDPPLPPEEQAEEPPVCRRVTYTYDAAGNRLSENRDGLTINSTYGLANEVLTAGRLRYAYDLRGNQTEKIFPGGQKRLFTYNVADQMTAFSRFKPAKPNQGIPAITDLLESYTYSPFGERTGLFKPNLTDHTKDRLTHMLWDRGRPIEEFWQPVDQAVPMQGKRYLWALGQLLEQGATKFQGTVPAGAPEFELASSYFQGDASRYAMTDHLGSIRLLTKPTGEVAQKTTWGPWGELLEGGTGSRFGYTGHQREAGSGFHYSVFRFLDPRNGRWSQRDPIGFAGGQANLYQYVGSNPTGSFDPFGLDEEALIRRTLTLAGERETYDAESRINGERLAPVGIAAGAFVLGTAAYATGTVLAAAATSAESMVGWRLAKSFPGLFGFLGMVSVTGTGAGTSSSSCGRAALDANALMRGIEKGEAAAVDAALAGRTVVMSRQAVREFLKKGDKEALRQFLTERGGQVGRSGTQSEIQALQQQAATMGRVLKPKDASVAAAAAKEGVPVITRDGSFRRFLDAVGIGGEGF